MDQQRGQRDQSIQSNKEDWSQETRKRARSTGEGSNTGLTYALSERFILTTPDSIHKPTISSLAYLFFLQRTAQLQYDFNQNALAHVVEREICTSEFRSVVEGLPPEPPPPPSIRWVTTLSPNEAHLLPRAIATACLGVAYNQRAQQRRLTVLLPRIASVLGSISISKTGIATGERWSSSHDRPPSALAIMRETLRIQQRLSSLMETTRNGQKYSGRRRRKRCTSCPLRDHASMRIVPFDHPIPDAIVVPRKQPRLKSISHCKDRKGKRRQSKRVKTESQSPTADNGCCYCVHEKERPSSPLSSDNSMLTATSNSTRSTSYLT